MKIRSVDAYWVHIPIPSEKQHTSDFGRTTSFDATLVRIDTECGLTGWGEAKSQVGSMAANQALTAMIREEFAPLLVGEDPRDITRLWESLYNGSRAHYALREGRVFPVLGRRGITISALSGIDCALWDILGKSLGVPVWRLLGGRRSPTMPAYASGGWAGPDKIGEQLLGYVEAGGFRAVKMRVGIIDTDPRHSARRVAAARTALGPDCGLMCDAHGTFSVAEAKRFCRLVEDCNLAWLEEPVTADDKAGCAQVRAATDIPIAAGESEFTRHDFRDLAMLAAVDIFQPDLAICGGISEAMRISALASAHNLKLAPHLWAGGPGLRRRSACRRRVARRVHRRIFARRQPAAARSRRRVVPRPGRGNRDPRPARSRHNRAREFPCRSHRKMKALFLGNVAADTANGIKDRLPSGLGVEIFDDPQQLMRVPEAAADADILVSNQWRAEYPPAPRLKLVQSVATGIELIDLAALPPRVTVCNAFGHETAIAEYVLMVMLVWSHRFREIEGNFRTRSSWQPSWVQSGAPHGEILGSTVGIVGLGRVGYEVARRAAAFGCRIIAANRSAREPGNGVEQVFPLSELDRVLAECDYVVLCTALGPETERLIDARRLALMKRSAFLVNIARGAVVDEGAIYAALRDCTIGGAALDVWWRYPDATEPERRPSRYPFHELPNVIMTPHCSGWTEGMVARRWAEVAGNINRFVRGEPLQNLVLTT